MILALSLDLDGFETGSAVHLIAVAVCLLATLVSSWLGLRWRERNPMAERRLSLAWAIFIILTQVFTTAWWLSPTQLNWSESLPLHICDIVGVLAAVAMLTHRRWVWSTLYFCGIGLCIIAFIMPSVHEGPAHLVFYLFWMTHLQIVGTAVYLVVVRRFRPTLRDWFIVEVLLTLYTLVIFPLDVALDWNYGYIGPIDSSARIMGPWPVRVLYMYLTQAVLLAFLLAPWLCIRRGAHQRVTQPD